ESPNSEYEWGGIRCLAFAPDGKSLVAGGMGPADQNSAGIDGPMHLEIFDTQTGKSLATLMNAAHKGMLTSLYYHPKAEYVLAAGGGGKAGDSGIGSLWVWDPGKRDKDGKPVAPAMQVSEVVSREILPGPDGKTFFSVGMLKEVSAGRIELWDR